MKKHVALLCAALMAVCCLTLGACAGSGGSGTTAGSASSAASVDFTGTWKVAGAQRDGYTLVGNLNRMSYGVENIVTTVQADGTGKFEQAGETVEMTWVEKDGDTMTVTADGASGVQVFDMQLRDGVLYLDDPTGATADALMLTHDGSLPGYPVIEVGYAKAITSEDALLGTWTLTCLNYDLITMYPDDDQRLKKTTDGDDLTVTFSKGGTASFLGSDATFTVGANGAMLSDESVELPLSMLDGRLIIDCSAQSGSSQLLYVLTK